MDGEFMENSAFLINTVLTIQPGSCHIFTKDLPKAVLGVMFLAVAARIEQVFIGVVDLQGSLSHPAFLPQQALDFIHQASRQMADPSCLGLSVLCREINCASAK